MAKKKPSHAQEEIGKLKNVNHFLINQHTEHRNKINTLQAEIDAMNSQLDDTIAAAIENDVLSVSVAGLVRDMASRVQSEEHEEEVAPLKREMEDLALRLEKETLALRVKPEAEEDTERNLAEGLRVLKLEAEKVLDEKTEKEREIQELVKQRDFALLNSQESEKAMNQLKGDIARVIREKGEIQSLRKAQVPKTQNLEQAVGRTNNSLKISCNEEAAKRAKILKLEKSVGLAVEKGNELMRENSALVSEKKEIKKSIEVLTEKRDTVRRVLDMVRGELEDKRRELDEANRARDEIEQVKVRQEHGIAELQGEVGRLKGDVDNMRKEFEEEKNTTKKLELQIEGLEGKLGKSEAELGQMRTQREKLNAENKKLENNVAVLTKEKEALQTMLKNTAALVCHESNANEAVHEENKFDGEIVPYAEELNTIIRNAYKRKKEVEDDLKLQIVSLQKNVDEAYKGEGLWTMISSATTIFAAVLAGYLARRR